MSSNDSDVLIGGISALVLGDEAAGSDNIESGHAEKSLRVVDAFRFEDFSADWYGGVDGVGDDEDIGIGASVGTGFGKVADDGGVGVEEVYAKQISLHCECSICIQCIPSRVMPGFRGTPAGTRTISAPVRAFFRPSASDW